MENAIEQKTKIKYEFENEGQYLVAQYREQLQFALFQVERQYESAKNRQRSEIKDIKVFGIALLVIILAMPAGILMAISGGRMLSAASLVFGLAGCFLVIIDMPFILYAMPLCLYKVLRGYVYLQISKNSRFGLWLCKKWKIPEAASEIKQCEDYIRKYKLILEEIDELEKDLLLLEDVDLKDIKIRMANVDTKPVIKVVNTIQGTPNYKIRKISTVITIILYVCMAIIFFRFYADLIQEMKYLFRHI